MLIKDIISESIITCAPDISLEEALQLMSEHRMCILPVVDRKGRLLGVLQESDLLAKVEEVPHGFSVATLLGEYLDSTSNPATVLQQTAGQPISQVMNRWPLTIAAETNLNLGLQLMLDHGRSRLLVTDDGKPVGIVSSQDIMGKLIHLQKTASRQHPSNKEAKI